LADAADCLGLELQTSGRQQLLTFLQLLQRWNATYNLTSVKDIEHMLSQHVLDCLAAVAPLAGYLGDQSARLLDVGSGGGLPGVVLAVVMPQLQITCVDTVGKKAAFIRQVASELALPNLRAIHARVEAMPGEFDVITSRAFASLSLFCSLSQSRLADGGVWLAMKGKYPSDEIAELPKEINVFHVEQLRVPMLDAERCLVWMRPS